MGPVSPRDVTTEGKTGPSRLQVVRARLERLLLWRVWERMLEIEFVDRSVALAAKAFVSFLPTVIIVAAFVPEDIRTFDRLDPHAPPRHAGGRAPTDQGRLRVGGRHPDGHRDPRTGPHDLLRDVVHDRPAARLPPRVAAAAPRRSRRISARRELAAAGPGLHGGARGAARRPRERTGPRSLRGRVTGGDDRAVVVQRVVAPPSATCARGCSFLRR